jgi:hypothetical protein
MKRFFQHHQRYFWIVLVIILISGAVPRVLIYDYSLPYIADPDEPSLYLLAQQWRGKFEFPNPDYHNGYPPIYPALNLAVQVVMEQGGQPAPGDVIGVLRLLSVGFSVLTAFFAALIARRLLGDMAAWLAAAFWSLSPVLVRQAPQALTNPLAVLVTTVTLWLAVIAATDRTKRHFAVWSILCGVVGIFVKYPVAPALAPGGLVIAWVLFREDWKQGARYIAALVALAAVAFGLLVLNDGLDYSSSFVEVEKRTTGWANLFKPRLVLDNLEQALSPLDPMTPTVIAVIVALGVIAALVARRQERPHAHIGGLALVGAMFVVQPWAVTIFSIVSETRRIKDVLPATSAGVVLLSVALAQIALMLPKRWTPAAQAVIVVALGVVVARPQLADTRQLVEDYSPPDTRVALRAWAESTLDPDWVLVTYENEKVFNNYWSGLPGAKWFNWYRIDDISEKSLQEWREMHMVYAVLTTPDVFGLTRTPEGQAYLDAMLLLREFYTPPDHRGPEMAVYRLWRMEQEVEVSFGDAIRLVGYDGGAVAPGEDFAVRLYWQADRTPQRDYSLFVHFAPEDAREQVHQWDGPPVKVRPTYTWDEPTETLIGDTIRVSLPPDVPPGRYRVLLGLYDSETWQTLPVTLHDDGGQLAGVVGGDALHFTTITVE